MRSSFSLIMYRRQSVATRNYCPLEASAHSNVRAATEGRPYMRYAIIRLSVGQTQPPQQVVVARITSKPVKYRFHSYVSQNTVMFLIGPV